MARKYDSEETKQKILSSSVRLFIEKGYHETTMTKFFMMQAYPAAVFTPFFTQKMAFLQN